jgi:hypothetical protein
VSVEPVIDAKEALECMEWCAGYVDFWKVGKLNHASRVAKMAPEGWKEPDWPKFLKDVKKFLKGKPHMIKKDLAQYE